MTITELYVLHKIAEEKSDYWTSMMRETFCGEEQRAKMGAEYEKAHKLTKALKKKMEEVYESLVKEVGND